MTGEPADAGARRKALDPTRSFIVQAPAGSGKTELLTRRVLTLLATVDEPEEILAITFTRKAAAEMRQRVVEALAHAASGARGANDYEEAGLRLAQAVLERDAAHGWRLLEDPGRLGMRTIDSLATRLAHRLPIVSQLGAPTGVVDDASALYREAAESFLESHLESIDLVSLQRGNRLEQLRSLFADLLAVRDQWRRYVLDDLGDERLRELLQSMLDALVRSRLEAVREVAPPGLADTLAAPLKRSAAYLVAQADLDPSVFGDVQRRIVSSADRAGRLPDASLDALDDWLALSDYLLTVSGTVRKRLDASTGFPPQSAHKALDVAKGELAAHKTDMEPTLRGLEGEPLFVERLLEVRRLPNLVYSDQDWALLGQLATSLRALLAELQVVFAARRELDFIEISLRAQQALGDDDAPTDLALSMDLKLKHLLVDEFQDTSHSQFALFERLIAGWAPEDGRTFFCVGDPMQSIYRFREGDVGLFLRAADEGIGPMPLEFLRLSVNFRSAPTVVDWINDGFRQAFPAKPDRDIGAVTYGPSIAHLEIEGAVDVHVLPAGDDKRHERREGERVAALVSDALAEDPAQSIGVLMRARTHATHIVAALQARGIPYRAIELDRLDGRPVVRDITALAIALRFPHDRVNWLAVLRGPLCGLVLADLHALVSASEQRPLIDLLRDPDRQAALSADGGQRVARFLGVVESAVERAPRSAVLPWVEAVWLRLGGPSVCRDDIDLEAAERCFARLVELEEQGALWRREAIGEAMARLFAGDGADPSVRVQLMTLHKSKGLEFDTVILPALARGGRTDGARLFDWFEATIDSQPRLLLAPIDPSGVPDGLKNPIGRLLRRYRSRADEAERLRLFYVACTRARRRLHLVATLKTGDDGVAKAPSAQSLLAPLWPVLRGAHEHPAEPVLLAESMVNVVPLGTMAADDDGAASGVTSGTDIRPPSDATDGAGSGDGLQPPPLVRTVSDWSLPEFERFEWVTPPLEPPPVQAIDYDWRGTIARDVGTVVHRVLQRLSLLPPAERKPPDSGAIGRIARELRTLGVTDAQLDEATGLVVQAIINTLEESRGRWILDDTHDERRSEWALTVPQFDEAERYIGSRRVIIDRTFVDGDGTRWIVDYKTGSHEGADPDGFLDTELERYREQLEGYASIIGRIDSRPLRLGLWFPMVRGWREWARVAPGLPTGNALP